ncbi:putative holin-like toxin [Heyndrickxia vini]|uniref:Holin-like toxin n=1 Tax=Heyndrickxia vini TaxID=1476025 RepID=A0ABX7E7R4_9BACI|nr:putative holin-like toxin [Heyndrickxia vini]
MVVVTPKLKGGRSLMVTFYEALSLMMMFGSLIVTVITVVISLTKKK